MEQVVGQQLAKAGVQGTILVEDVEASVTDAFVDDYGSQDHLFERYGLQPSQIAKTIRAAHSTMQTN